MITDTIKGHLAGAALALFSLSIVVNAVQFHLLGKATERATQAESAVTVASDAADTCTRSIDVLKKNADDAALVAKGKIEAAKKTEQRRAARAQTILAMPPSVPGNDCASALDRASTWLTVAP